MPSPTTALQIIEDALGLTNAVGADQTLTNDETSDCLRVFNDVLEEGSTQSMFVYGQANQSFNTVAGTATYTIGTGGTWNTVRPERINEPAYATISGVTFPYFSITQAQYNLISLKTQAGGGTDINQCYLYVNEFPLGLITLWPVPNAIFAITWSINRILTAITTAAASISFPPGYAKAFKYKLGVELAPLFGKKMAEYPDVAAIQKETWGGIKRSNSRPAILNYDIALLNRPTSGYPDGP
jgi:hypothetical protein